MESPTAPDTDLKEVAARPLRDGHLPELLVAFLIGISLFRFYYSGTGGDTGERVNLAGNDCFYHVKMAALFPQIGFDDQFPWLSQTIFNDRFVSHHYGFHALLSPFVLLSQRLTGDYIPGARWFMAVSFGLVLMIFMRLLIGEGVRYRWLFLALLLMLPADFYIRHANVRAIDLSLIFLLIGTHFILRGRYLLLSVAIVMYTHVYLGSFFLPVIAGLHFLCGLFAAPKLKPDWRLVIFTVIGAVVGITTHPYFPENIDFLRTQVFGSGLTPEVPVGREWRAYEDVWRFVNLVAVPLTIQTAAVILRARFGRRLSRNEWTMLAVSLFFFVLTLKARRFIEYWPMFSVLSSALLVGPLLERFAPHFATSLARGWRTPVLAMSAACAFVLTALLLYARSQNAGTAAHVVSWWPAWVTLGVIVAGLEVLRRRSELSPVGRSVHVARLSITALGVTAAIGAVVFVGAGQVHETVHGWAGGKFDLDEVEAAMTALKDASHEGDIVFTDDWDIFPVYFYFNHWNYFIVGLDPVFTHRLDPELWQRYVKLSRGQVPSRIAVNSIEDGQEVTRLERVELPEIRDLFHARFVVVDRDHQPLARKLEAAPELAERIYPDQPSAPGRVNPYTIYRILDPS